MKHKKTKTTYLQLLIIISMFCFNFSSFSQTDDIKTINTFMNNWHLSAKNADHKSFFNAMDKDAVYIGTDSNERWTKKEFKKFAMPFFKKGKAWDFKTKERFIYFSDDKKYAWFNEKLSTWMGICRASGVLKRYDNNKWKVKHYHLSVTVPNEKIKSFIKLIYELE